MHVLRSLFFDVLFYSFTFLYLTFFLPFTFILPRSFTKKVVKICSKGVYKLLCTIIGIEIRITGLEHIPNYPVVIACQHQSAFDTFLPAYLFDEFVIVAKNELRFIPILSSYLKRLDSIFIKRSDGVKALKTLIQKSKEAFERKHSVFIFPEGTRAYPNQPVKCQVGVYFLYHDLNASVLPISLNSGLFWGRRSFIKKPGVIEIKIHPLIEVGFDRKIFLQTLERVFDAPDQLQEHLV